MKVYRCEKCGFNVPVKYHQETEQLEIENWKNKHCILKEFNYKKIENDRTTR